MREFPVDDLRTAVRGAIQEVIPVERGYTGMGRWIVRTGVESVFIKFADTPESMQWLRDERKFYAAIRDTFTPRQVAFGESPARVFLALEDLSGAFWPPPWTPKRVTQVLGSLSRLASHSGMKGFPRLEDSREGLTGWKRVAAAPADFLSLGLASRAWLDRALPALCEAEKGAILEGSEMLHCDVRSDNICFDGERAMLIDWNWACTGNAKADVAFWAPSLHAEGGPSPEEVAGREPELAALVAGYFAWNAGQPAGTLPPRIREVQRFQLTAALPWAARALGLKPPDGTGCLTA
ncbi:MAG: hypothetical protein FD180_789 [Planctomycetota bacterium]|nr:MAG: hypothetical protein FD180_789 [Planctomycetota bacterium]